LSTLATTSCAMTLFFMNPASSYWLGAYNVMPLLWLASTLTNWCGTPSNPWSQERTNILEPQW
jgi:hypothetical protein